jgi:hypothetical protein
MNLRLIGTCELCPDLSLFFIRKLIVIYPLLLNICSIVRAAGFLHYGLLRKGLEHLFIGTQTETCRFPVHVHLTSDSSGTDRKISVNLALSSLLGRFQGRTLISAECNKPHKTGIARGTTIGLPDPISLLRCYLFYEHPLLW